MSSAYRPSFATAQGVTGFRSAQSSNFSEQSNHRARRRHRRHVGRKEVDSLHAPDSRRAESWWRKEEERHASRMRESMLQIDFPPTSPPPGFEAVSVAPAKKSVPFCELNWADIDLDDDDLGPPSWLQPASSTKGSWADVALEDTELDPIPWMT